MKPGVQPKKLAIVSDAIHPYNKGGKETRIHELSTRLAKQGHEVHIYTMKWWDGPNDRIEHGVQLHAISKRYPLYSGDRRSIRTSLHFALHVLKMLRADFDVADVDHMPFFPLFSMKFVCLIKRRPLYATWHEVWGRKTWKDYLGKLWFFGYIVERYSVRLPNHIIAVSPQTASRLRHELGYRGPLTLAPNGVDYDRIAGASPANTSHDIVFVGRLLAHKNVDMLIHAVALLRRHNPNIRCLVIGDGPETVNLKTLAHQLNLAKNVTFTGFVEHDTEVHSYMKTAKVFVLPSAREGFGIAVLEANAAGLPVITTDFPGNAARQLIEPGINGYISAPTPTALAEHIAQALQPSASLQPQQVASRYNWPSVVQIVERALAI